MHIYLRLKIRSEEGQWTKMDDGRWTMDMDMVEDGGREKSGKLWVFG